MWDGTALPFITIEDFQSDMLTWELSLQKEFISTSANLINTNRFR